MPTKGKTIREATQEWVREFNAIDTEMFRVLYDDGYFLEVTEPGDKDEYFEDAFPMWGTMWSFDDPCDADYWMHDEDGIEKLSECGFRVYYSEEFDEYYFGIEGAGYDFYESHWIPLYKARGLKWHDPETENND